MDDNKGSNPDEAQRLREEAAMLKAFFRLPRLVQIVFELHRYDGLDYDSIAMKFGLSVKEVERYISFALRHLAYAVREVRK